MSAGERVQMLSRDEARAFAHRRLPVFFNRSELLDALRSGSA